MTDLVGLGTAPVAEGAPPVLLWSDGASWDRFVMGATDGTLGHLWAWRDIVTRTYGHRVFNLAAVRGGVIAGVLPLVLIRSRLFGRALVSMPYLDYAGVCSDGDRGAEIALLAAAIELSTRHAAPLDVRQLHAKDLGLPASLDKVTMTLDVTGGEDQAWSQIRSNRRGQVRKATRHGLTATVAGAEAVDAFYRVWAANMRDLGSPVHPRSFFERVLSSFPRDARVVLVDDAGTPVGGGIVLRFRDRVVLPWSSSLRASLPKGPNQLLYWEAIRHAISTGATTFDFGRSSVGAGTFDAKREWGAQPEQLYWHGSGAGDRGSRVEQLAWATRVWRRLPLPVTVAVGSRVRGGISR
jgi:FemAB-related protein (PEP-CTERM system-associated)